MFQLTVLHLSFSLWFLAFDLSLNRPHTLALSIAQSLALPLSSFFACPFSLVFYRCVSWHTYINSTSHFPPCLLSFSLSTNITTLLRRHALLRVQPTLVFSNYLSPVCRNTPSSHLVCSRFVSELVPHIITWLAARSIALTHFNACCCPRIVFSSCLPCASVSTHHSLPLSSSPPSCSIFVSQSVPQSSLIECSIHCPLIFCFWFVSIVSLHPFFALSFILSHCTLSTYPPPWSPLALVLRCPGSLHHSIFLNFSSLTYIL